MSPLRKDTIPNQAKKSMGLNKYQCLKLDAPPFIPGNKILLNEDNDDNPKTTDTSQSENMIRHILIEMILLKKWKTWKNTNDDDKYKDDT